MRSFRLGMDTSSPEPAGREGPAGPRNLRGSALERLALRLHRALLRGQRLLLPLHAGFLVVLPLADLRQDAGLLGRLLEALERALDRLAFLHSDTRHARGHLPPSGLNGGPLHGRCRRRMQGPASISSARRPPPAPSRGARCSSSDARPARASAWSPPPPRSCLRRRSRPPTAPPFHPRRARGPPRSAAPG